MTVGSVPSTVPGMYVASCDNYAPRSATSDVISRAKNAVQVRFRFTNVFADNGGEIDLVKAEVAAHDSIEFSVI